MPRIQHSVDSACDGNICDASRAVQLKSTSAQAFKAIGTASVMLQHVAGGHKLIKQAGLGCPHKCYLDTSVDMKLELASCAEPRLLNMPLKDSCGAADRLLPVAVAGDVPADGDDGSWGLTELPDGASGGDSATKPAAGVGSGEPNAAGVSSGEPDAAGVGSGEPDAAGEVSRGV